jgi:hypothetical protein
MFFARYGKSLPFLGIEPAYFEYETGSEASSPREVIADGRDEPGDISVGSARDLGYG